MVVELAGVALKMCRGSILVGQMSVVPSIPHRSGIPQKAFPLSLGWVS